MAIQVQTVVTNRWRRLLLGSDYAGPRFSQCFVSGLTAGAANLIPHGLPFVPGAAVSYRPGANGKWGETQVPDATAFYISVGSGGATSGTIDWKKPPMRRGSVII